jgi:hypothetical protein
MVRLSEPVSVWNQFFLCFINVCPKKWLIWLPLAEFWYNTSYHFSIGRSPFEALYMVTLLAILVLLLAWLLELLI